VKAHKHKQLIKRYLARKARYLDGKAKYQAALAAHGNQSTAVLSEAVEETVDVPSDTSEVPESPAAHGNQSTAVLSEAVEETVDVSSDTSEVPESPSCIETSVTRRRYLNRQ
jgi:hypothetical protein